MLTTNAAVGSANEKSPEKPKAKRLILLSPPLATTLPALHCLIVSTAKLALLSGPITNVLTAVGKCEVSMNKNKIDVLLLGLPERFQIMEDPNHNFVNLTLEKNGKE